MNKLPEGWKRTTVGDLVTFNYGKSLPAASRSEGPVPVCGSNGVVGSHSEAITKAPAIIIGRKGSIGEVHFTSVPCFPIDTTYFVDDFHGMEPHFLAYLFRDLPFTKMNRATAVPGLNREEAYSQSVGLPPLSEQKRIVAKIDSLTGRTTGARTDLARIPTLIARYKQRFLALAFSGELTDGWRDKQVEPFSTNLKSVRAKRKTDKRLSRRKRFALKPEFALPSTWDWISPDEVVADAKYSIGIGPFGSNLVRADYRESGVRLVFVRDIRRERFDDDNARFIDPEKAKDLHQHLASPGDVLITKMGDPPGDSSLFPDDEQPAVITADCIKMTPHADLAEARFLNYCIRSPQVQSQFKAITAGVAQQKVSLDRFRKLALPVAPLAEQVEIVRRIESAFNWLDRVAADHAAASNFLPKLDSAILAKAFRGELVPQDPNDEPASALLERIQAELAATPRGVRVRQKRAPKQPENVIRLHRDDQLIEVDTKTSGASAMTKSRQDYDVMGQPYLAGLIKKEGAGTAQELFQASDLPVADFYKQLAWEIKHKHIRDDDEKLEAL